jgi:SAM-dependent methyltransferase
MSSDLMEKAEELRRRNVFLGGPKHKFISAGRGQLEILLKNGLVPDSFVLDIGCGCLRGGFWSINFLRPGHYFGIEPNKAWLDAGIEVMLGPELVAEKKPSFSNTADFDFSVFGQTFDFVIARSVWTHASRDHIRAMLASFERTSREGARFIASIVEPRRGHQEYVGTAWVGRSHESDTPGMAHHGFSTIQALCAEAGLVAEALDMADEQLWVRVSRPEPEDAIAEDEDAP